MRPGWQTSEFQMTLMTQTLGAIVASGVIPSEGPWLQLAGIAMAVLAQLGYTYSRGMVKAAQPPAAPTP